MVGCSVQAGRPRHCGLGPISSSALLPDLPQPQTRPSQRVGTFPATSTIRLALGRLHYAVCLACCRARFSRGGVVMPEMRDAMKKAGLGPNLGERKCTECGRPFTPRDPKHKRCPNCAKASAARRGYASPSFPDQYPDYFDPNGNLKCEYVTDLAQTIAERLASFMHGDDALMVCEISIRNNLGGIQPVPFLEAVHRPRQFFGIVGSLTHCYAHDESLNCVSRELDVVAGRNRSISLTHKAGIRI